MRLSPGLTWAPQLSTHCANITQFPEWAALLFLPTAWWTRSWCELKTFSCSSICCQDWAGRLTSLHSNTSWVGEYEDLEDRATLRPVFPVGIGNFKRKCNGNPCYDTVTPSIPLWAKVSTTLSRDALCARIMGRSQVTQHGLVQCQRYKAMEFVSI